MPITFYNEGVVDICRKLKGGEKMPRNDGTGPMGLGSMTGRGMGYCQSGITRTSGAGFCGRRVGRGNRRMFAAEPLSPQTLAEEKALLEQRIAEINALMPK